jgi:hypothetical protein
MFSKVHVASDTNGEGPSNHTSEFEDNDASEVNEENHVDAIAGENNNSDGEHSVERTVGRKRKASREN